MSTSKNENARLKAELAQANGIILKQKEIIQQLSHDFHLNFQNAIEAIVFDYSTILNPIPITLKTAHKGKHEEFSISAPDVLCIISKGKVKSIRLIKSIENIKGTYRQTDTIVVDNNDSLEKFRHRLDSISYHLIQVSRNTVVNMKHYSLKNDILETNLDSFVNTEYSKIEISDSHRDDFIVKKQMLNEIISLQKKLLPYID